MTMKKILALVFIAASYQGIQAQSGMLDHSFGSNGYVLTSGTKGNFGSHSIRQCFVGADGKLFFVLLINNKTLVSRRLSNGNADDTYGRNGYSVVVSMYVSCAALQADGKIVVAGTTNGVSDFMLARYNTDGSLDPSFGNGGITITDIGSTNDYLNAIVITTDNKIIVGGSTLVNGQGQFVLAKYTAAGIPDNAFGNHGIITTSFDFSSSISSLALQADDKIVATGSVYTNDGGDFALARYNADGSPDLSFNSAGKTISNFGFLDVPSSVVVNSNGKIYVGGSSADISGFLHFRIARYDEGGSLDPSFNGGTGSIFPGFGDSYDNLTSIRLDSDGKIVAAGYTNLSMTSNDIEVIRVNSDGTIDNNFGTSGNGLVTADIASGEDQCNFLVIQADGKILTGGSNAIFTNTVTFTFTCFRFNTDGSADVTFDNAGSLNDFVPLSNSSYGPVFRQADGKLLAVNFVNDGTNNRPFLKRLNANGTLDSSYGQNGQQEINSAVGVMYFQPDGKLLALAYFPQDNNDIALLRYDLDGTLDQTFGNGGMVTSDFGGNESASVAAFQPDGKIIISAIERDDNGSDFLIVRYNVDGSVDNSFGDGGHFRMNIDNEDQVQSIAVAPDGKIVFAGTGYVFPPDFFGVYFDLLLFRLNPDGTLDDGFGDHGKLLYLRSNNNFMGQMQVLNNRKIVFTDFESPDNSSYNLYLQRLNEDGSLDQTFGQNGRTPCNGSAIALQDDEKILLLGSKINDRNNTDFTLTRFTQDGVADDSFGVNGMIISSFTQLDNFLYYATVTGTDLFVAGSGADQMGDYVGIVAKFLLEPPITINCPSDKIVNTGKDSCSAKVYGLDPIVTPAGTAVRYELSGATTGSGSGLANGVIFNKGVTTVKYSIISDTTKSCGFTVTVQDKQLPTIDNVRVSQSTLWPADHKMKDITVNYSVNDNCGIASTQLLISSNEPVQSGEQGDKSPDWEVVDNHHIRLRAERLESGNGRIYTITMTTTDLSGNHATATISVNVPKSMSNSGGGGFIMTVAPNPSSSYFLVTVTSRSEEKINIRLLDNKGNIVSTISDASNYQSMKLGDKLKAGIYFIEATQSGITKTMKLVKQ
jgi:uncharacterized delta-60 repeat protein